MSSIFYYFFMGLGLSMDAFSLAIVYGMNKINLKSIITLSLMVGLFHFVMPNISGIIGNFFTKTNFSRYTNLIAGLVFLILTVEMIISINEKDTKYKLDKLLDLLLFSFAVSIDSFTLGFALGVEKENIVLAGIIFTIISGLFTFLGLILGKILSEKIGFIAKFIGIIILLIFSIKYLFF